MLTEVVRPEMVQAGLGLVGLAMAYTQNQKLWIRAAFDNQCAAFNVGMKGEHRGGLEVHHRLPQLYAYQLLGLTEEQVDSPTNGLPFCENHHVKGDHADVIHPDQQAALEDFRRGNKEAFQELQHQRQEAVKEGKPYWNTKWDSAMAAFNAFKVREYAKKTKLPFPFHKHNGSPHTS